MIAELQMVPVPNQECMWKEELVIRSAVALEKPVRFTVLEDADYASCYNISFNEADTKIAACRYDYAKEEIPGSAKFSPLNHNLARTIRQRETTSSGDWECGDKSPFQIRLEKDKHKRALRF